MAVVEVLAEMTDPETIAGRAVAAEEKLSLTTMHSQHSERLAPADAVTQKVKVISLAPSGNNPLPPSCLMQKVHFLLANQSYQG